MTLIVINLTWRGYPMAKDVRRQLWGAILAAVLMVLMTFSTLAAPSTPSISELEEDVDTILEEITPDMESEDAEISEKTIGPEMTDLEYPDVYYPSGLEMKEPLGDEPAETQSNGLLDYQGVQGAWAQGVNGSGVNVALIDTGIDLGHPDLIGTYAIDERVLGQVTNEVVVQGASSQGVDVANLAHDYVMNYAIKRNGTGMTEFADYTLYPGNGTIIFTPTLGSNMEITADYTYTSPYYGWPIAFDPVSMSNFLEQNHTRDTWFANTTQVGPGPFEYSHTLIVDGETEFGGTYEKWGTDPQEKSATLPGGNKEDFDLTSLNLTYDKDYWYVGFDTWMRVTTENASIEEFVPHALFGVMFDVDNETGGTTTVPEGKLIDTNTSHGDDVLDAEISPDGTMVATASRDGLVRIWFTSNATRIKTLYGHDASNPPFSVAWSPDSTKIASLSDDKLFVWNTLDWGNPWGKSATVSSSGDALGDYGIYGLASILDFSPNGTTVAYGGNNIGGVFRSVVNFYDYATGYSYHMVLSDGAEFVQSVAFNPSNADEIAANVIFHFIPPGTLIENDIGIYDLSTASLNTGTGTTVTVGTYLDGHSPNSIVNSVAWSPNGQRLVSGSEDNTVKVWLSDGTNIATINVGKIVTCVDWSPSPLNKIVYSTVRSGSPASALLATADENGNPIDSDSIRLDYYSAKWSPLAGDDLLVTASADFSARLWYDDFTLVRVLVAQKPDYALYVEGGGRWNQKDEKWEPGFNSTRFYTWNDATGWTYVVLSNLTTEQIEASQNWGGSQFIEVAIPRSLLGNPVSMAVEMFSAPHNDTHHAQDSVPEDRNVFDIPERGAEAKNGIDWLPIVTSLSTFTWKEIKYYYTNVSLSKSGVFHFGFHPSPHIIQKKGAVGVLVVDSKRPFDYDTVYVDLNIDNVFDSQDVILTRDSPTATVDEVLPLDGIPDTSAGIMYYMSDGFTPIPYSEKYTERRQATEQDFRNVIPLNGDMVAFIGEFFIDEDTGEKAEHGTAMASVIAAQGVIGATPDEKIMGVAPGAKFIILANTRDEIEHSWNFAVEGYDGKIATGDEAQIILNAFNYPRVVEKGWDRYSRKVDEMSMVYGKEKNIFVGPAGDYGWGYGTVASPNAAPGTVTVGRASDFSYWAGGLEGPNPHYGDVEISSSRGPTPVGISKPDVVAIGSGRIDIPLFNKMVSDGTTAKQLVPTKGSDISAASVTGVLALIYEAYKSKHGVIPTATEAKEILMSGADDISYDTLSQGAGFVNATRSVSIALGNGGLAVSPSTFSYGYFLGKRYPSFANILAAGDTDVKQFTLENSGSTPTSAVVSTTIFNNTGYYNFTTNNTVDTYATDGEIIFWINSSGVWKVKDEGMGVYNVTSQVTPYDASLWNNADLVKITAYSSYEMMVKLGGVSPTGRKTYVQNYSFTMKVYDWNNVSIDPFPNPEAYPTELNTIAEVHSEANYVLGVDPMTNYFEARIHDPAARIDDGLVVVIEPWDERPDEDYTWEILIETYEKVNWPWLNITPITPINIPASGQATFDATMRVPTNAMVGSYEGAITVADTGSGKNITIPILVNVAMNSPNVRFGGVNGTSDLYDNNRIFGGYEKGMRGSTRLARPYTGDWRFYYFNIPDAGFFKSAGLKLWIEGNWTLKPSDMDFYILGYRAPNENVTRYGPYYLGVLGKSEEAREPGFETNTNESSEVIAFDMKTGINVLALHGVILNGSKPFEFVFGGGGGWIQVTPPEIRERRSVRYGQKDLRIISNMDFTEGMTASAVGPAITESYREVEIEQDYQTWWQFDNWGEYLMRGSYTWIINVSNAYILDVHIVGDDKAPDLDLGVFTDENLDGELELEEVKDIYCVKIGGTKWDYDADADADERVVWIQPPDGQYIIKVLGFDINGKFGHFDIDIAITLGSGEEGYTIAGTGPDDIIIGTEGGLLRLTPVGVTMHWNLQGSTPPGEYGGAVMIGTPQAPTIVIVPVTIIYDPDPPEIISFALSATGYEIEVMTNRTTNHPRPTLQVGLADPTRGELDWRTIGIYLDGVNITSQSLISLPFGEWEGKFGYWDGTITYTPPERLVNGIHTLDVRVGDLTGNTIDANFTFVIDTQPPFINLIGPSIYSTRQPTAIVSGQTEAEKNVVIRELELVADESGYFQAEIALVEGENRIDVTAIDWFGKTVAGDIVRSNPNSVIQTIIYDLEDPVLTGVRFQEGTLTNQDHGTLGGTVEEYIAEGTTYDPRTVTLKINGEEVEIHYNGMFSRVLTLNEGHNTFLLEATDAAGNSVSMYKNITRDTAPPSLILDEVPSSTEDAEVVISGTVDPGSILTINGKFVSTAGGTFEDTVALQPGPNVIYMEAADSADNVRSLQVVIVRETGDILPYIIMAVLIIVGLLLGYLVGSRMRRGEIEPGEEEVEEEVLAEEPTEEEAEEVLEAEALVEEEDMVEVGAQEELIEEEV
ncbi:MAG: S8 family serine peptidase [Methanobacteriota archaeon]|nr:MAG: S8 family serine peptidase [Euryarchaeota archaeon]